MWKKLAIGESPKADVAIIPFWLSFDEISQSVNLSGRTNNPLDMDLLLALFLPNSAQAQL